LINIYLLALTSPIIISISQLLLKIGAEKLRQKSFLRQYLNIYVISAYSLFILVNIINIYVFSVLELSFATIMIGSSYIFVVILGVLVLSEKLSIRQISGVFFIVLGIFLSSGIL